MLVMIEGVDGSGKSTLVDDFLLQLHDEAINHSRGPLRNHPLHEYLWPLVNYRPTVGPSVVCDRWHVGELVYGPLYRGVSKLTPAMEAYLDMFLQSRGALKLWVDTPFETVQLRLKTRGEDFLQEQHVRLVWDWYRDHLPQRGWRAVPGTLQKQKRADLVETLIRDARRLSVSAPSTFFPAYVGPAEPKVVLFGDHNAARPDRPKYGQLPWVPYEDSPGHYVLSAVASQRTFPSYGVAAPRMLLDRDWMVNLEASAGDVPVLVVFGQQPRAAVRERGLESRFRVVYMQDPAVGTRSPFTVSRYGEFLLERIRRA